MCYVGHRASVIAVALSTSGYTLATGSEDNDVRLWNVGTGDCTAVIALHDARVTSVQFTPDDSRLVTASHDKSVAVIRLSDGSLERRLTGHAVEFYSLFISVRVCVCMCVYLCTSFSV